MRALFLQEIKTFFKSPSSIFIFIIPLILLVGLGYFIPAAYIIPSTISVGIVGSVLLYFGGGLEEIKRTSFLKAMGITKLNKVTTLAIKILFAGFVALITVVYVLFLGYFFTEITPFLAVDFGNLDESLSALKGPVHWGEIQWYILFYASILSLAVTLSLAFAFVAVSKSSLSFYLLTFGYIAALILFGGVIMPGFLLVGNNWFHWFYYLIPNYYTGNQITAAFHSGLSEQVHNLVVSLSEKLPNLPDGALNNFYGWLTIVVNQEGFIDMFDAMNDAVNNGVGSWSNIDGGEQISHNSAWWTAEFTKIGLAFKNDGLAGIADMIRVFASNASGDFWIDDFFYLIITMPNISQGIANGALTNILGFDADIINLFSSLLLYGDIILDLVYSGTTDTIIALVDSLAYVKAFDFTSIESIVDVFMPYIWIGFLTVISIWKFEWVS